MENKKKKVVLNILLLIVGLALVVSGIIKISGGSNTGKVSNKFISKFNAIYTLSGKIATDMKSASDLLLGISAKEKAKDYTGAAKDVGTSITKLDDAAVKINSLSTTIAEFKIMVEAVTDATVKESGLKLVSLLEQRNTATLKLVSDSKQLVEPAKKYYEDLAAGKTGTYLDNDQVYNLTQEINKDNTILASLATQIDSANKDLANLAGFQLKTTK
ncbi:MAG: hypothetical protein WC297_02660 [Candidatus Paceibacterota bacterium]|jgi:hypothetical protein